MNEINPKSYSLNPPEVTIYVTEKKPGVTSKHDLEDQCMKASVVSFEILNKKSCEGNALAGLQAVFHLCDLDSINLKVIGEGQYKEKILEHKDVEITAFAVKSILTHLYAAGCTKKGVISFQARKGLSENPTSYLSELKFICLNEEAKNTGFDFSSFNKDTISHTYAYLSARQLCIFFNPLQPKQLEKIENVLSQLFPRK